MIVFYYLTLVLFILVSFILCFVILIQEGKHSGLGASLGGDSGESLFGASTPEVLKKFTAYLSVTFLVGCVVLSLWTASLSRVKSKKMMNQTEYLDQ
ncbi:MAG: preprotein translocase subunit SecG [Chlamydiia bacterium]|nr:preprotein translocase subunit SecG [Chlamydiia bacterium]